jgi:uncharacterized SAM-binding protein YcdF (DUF218 family)
MLLASTAALVLAAFSPFASWIIEPLEDRFPQPVLERADGIIVLAGAELPVASQLHGHPQFNVFTDRLTTFLLLANRWPNARLVHSGAGTVRGFRQSDPARALILGSGIAPSRVAFESESRNTCESAQLSRQLVAPQPTEVWLLVTSAAHVPRAVACFRAAGWLVTPFPTDYKAGGADFSVEGLENLASVDLAVHEWVGLIYYRLRGLTHEIFPAPSRD